MKAAVVKNGSARFPCAPVPAGLEIIPSPTMYSIALPKGIASNVTEGQLVVAGQALCKNPRIGMFASLPGTVEKIRIIDGKSDAMMTAVDIAVTHDAAGTESADAPRDAGSDFAGAAKRCDITFSDGKTAYCVLFVDGDSPKVSNRWCFEKEYEKSMKALQLLGTAVGRENLFVVVGRKTAIDKKNRCAEYATVIETVDAYPDTLPEILVRKHQALQTRPKVAVIDGYRLVALAESMTTGRPPLVTLVSLQYGGNGKIRLLQVSIGMRIGELIEKAGITLHDGDQVITGGELSGTACFNMMIPVTADTVSVIVIPAAEVSLSQNNACVNCGRCVTACPVQLRVDRIGKCVELQMIDQAVELGVNHCIECGICSAVCMTCRPLAHLMATGKQSAASAVEKNGGC